LPWDYTRVPDVFYEAAITAAGIAAAFIAPAPKALLFTLATIPFDKKIITLFHVFCFALKLIYALINLAKILKVCGHRAGKGGTSFGAIIITCGRLKNNFFPPAQIDLLFLFSAFPPVGI